MTNKEYRQWKAEQRARMKDMSLEELTEFTAEVERVKRNEAARPGAKARHTVKMIFVYIAAALIILGGGAYRFLQ